jgi:integrase
VDLGIVNGKRVRKSLYGKTQKEVAAKLRDALGRKSQGALVTGARQTFGQYLDRWLRDIVTPKCRPKTISSYRGLIERHIQPGLGHLALTKLAARDIQAFYAQKRDEELAPRTVVYLHALIRASLKHAERSGEIGYSPVNRVSAPTSTRPDIKPLTVEEAAKLLEVSATDRLAALWSLALHTGLRQGELLGLRWQDLDLDRSSLTVLQTIQVIDGKIETGAPKSKGSRRTVTIEPPALESLKAWRTRQIEERLKAGPAWTDSGLVFTSQVGTPLFARNVSRRWHQLLDEAGIERRGMHAARHTAATLLMAAGEHPKVVQELLGHATIALTLDTYSHVTEGQRKQATAKLSALLTPNVGIKGAAGDLMTLDGQDR